MRERNTADYELFLHRLIAGSAFLCALCILPVAQYLLVTTQLSSAKPAEDGVVAGASTDTTVVKAIVPVGAATGASVDKTCEDQKELDLSDLLEWQRTKKIALLRTYDQAVEPYKTTIPLITGTPQQIQEEKAALDKLITEEYSIYTKKVADVEQAVAKQQEEVRNRSCLLNSAQ